MNIDGVVADANVLLSAVIGKAALRVFTEFSVPIHTSQFNADEVLEYLPVMAQKYDLPIDLVLYRWHLLPMQVHQQYEYILYLDTARQALTERDPDDAHPLALALELHLPLWTNDKDLSGHGVECLTTAVLLTRLSRPRSR